MSDTPIRLSPLHPATQLHQPTVIDLAGWRIPEAYAAVEQEVAAVRAACGLADVSPHGKIQIEGAQAQAAVAGAFGGAPEGVGAGRRVEAGHVFCLRPDMYFLVTPPGGEAAALARLEAAISARSDLVTATDLTHGLADMRLIGPASRAVLSQLCALDFDPGRFPDLSARQTSVAKTRQLILRRDFGDLPAYTLLGAQSLGAYLWRTVMEAGREFGLTPVGVAALRQLEQ